MEQQNSKTAVMTVIQNTAPQAIAELDFVREKYVENYNHCHKNKDGDLMYHRNVVHFKQAIVGSEQLKSCDPFSLYACFATAAVNGYSLDPQDAEVYLIPLKGKAYLWRQTGAHVRRLKRTGQALHVEQAKLVYQGDGFEVENGRVISHKEKFESEIIIAAYVRFVLDESGKDIFFIYRKSDWEAWRKKSQMPQGENWNGNNGQPMAAFLRTKVVKHACLEKVWATGSGVVTPDTFNVEVDADSKEELKTIGEMTIPENLPQPSMIVTPAKPSYQAQEAAILMTDDGENHYGSVKVNSAEEGF